MLKSPVDAIRDNCGRSSGLDILRLTDLSVMIDGSRTLYMIVIGAGAATVSLKGSNESDQTREAVRRYEYCR